MKIIKKLNFKRVLLVYMIVYLLIASIYCGINGLKIVGEWDDYIFPAVTILEEHRISVYEEEITMIKEYFPEVSDYIENLGIDFLSGRKTSDGTVLPWYFPTYAIASIPIIILLRILHLPAIYAFMTTNIISVMCVLFVVFKCLKADEKTKLLLMLLLSVNPIMFYYNWPSGETLIYSFLAIGLICWHNDWYKRAAVFISLAGTMNSTIMSVGIFLIIDYAIVLIKRKEQNTKWLDYIKSNTIDVVKFGACFVIGLIPMAYFYYHTGYINLSASYSGFTQGRELTIQRFLAYLFDLNFGILPYFPIILILGIILLSTAIIKRNRRYILWFLAFIVNVFLYSVMVHINNGMSGIARYNVWGVLILIFGVCLISKDLIGSDLLMNTARKGILINILILALIIPSYDGSSCKNWTPIAEFVLDKCPQLYNPLHSTFNARTNHLDGGYEYETPVIYTADDGYTRKILASSKDKDKLNELFTSESKPGWMADKIQSLGENELYISIPKNKKVVMCENYTIGTELIFMDKYFNAKQYIVNGISLPESWGTWTEGNELEIRFKTVSDSKKLRGIINCGTFNEVQPYNVIVNGNVVSRGIANGNRIVFDFLNPGIGRVVNIKIEIPNAVSPMQLGQSSDDRALGLGLREMMFVEIQQ